MSGVRWLAIASLVVATATRLAAQAPLPIAERITTRLDRTTHVVLFSNHVAVVTITSESESFFHRATLDPSEYMVYLQAIEAESRKIGDDPVTSTVSTGDDHTVLMMHVGSRTPKVLRYSPLASLNMSTATIASIMDDIQNRVLATLPNEDEVRRWQPQVGDCVELRRGGEACVTEVGDDGTIVLVDAETSVATAISPDDRVRIVAAVPEDQE